MEKLSYKFLVVEDEIQANNSIVDRMKKYDNWKCAGAVLSLRDAIKITEEERPDLLFLDWEVRGGNTFILLEHLYTLENYNPYIIYFTGYQSDVPEIPVDIVNKYRVDIYLIKPIFDNLTTYLSNYLLEAEQKTQKKIKNRDIWIDTFMGIKEKIHPENIVFISQCNTNSRNKILKMNDGKSIEIKSNWKNCIKIAKEYKLQYAFANSRYYLINRQYISKLQKPYIWLNNKHKIEVTRDKWKEFF